MYMWRSDDDFQEPAVLPLRGFKSSNSGCEAWRQALLHLLTWLMAPNVSFKKYLPISAGFQQGRPGKTDSKVHLFFLLKYRDLGYVFISSVLKSTAAHAGITAAKNYASVKIITYITLGQWVPIA